MVMKVFLPLLLSLPVITADTPTPTKVLKTLDIHLSPNPLLTNDTTCITTHVCPTPLTRTISYFTTNSKAIIDGDVIYGSEADLLAANTTAPSKRAFSIRPFESSRKWPFGVVRYQYEDATTESGRGPLWEASIKKWTDMLPFLQFVKEPNGNVNNPNILMIRAVEDSVSYSHVGFVNFPEVLLGRPDLPESGYWYTHTIGHTLGLMHEHQRPDRPSYLTLDCSKLSTTPGSPPPVCGTLCAGTGCWFSTLSFGGDWSGTYDIQSIMHFNPADFAKDANDPPLKPISPVIFDSNRVRPTITDANRVCDIYYQVCRGVCGDGILALANGEVCDDGNNVDGDGCSADCKTTTSTPRCGDGQVQTTLGEQCEPPNTSVCDATCRWKVQPSPCGNGILEPLLGEQCDPPNTPTCDANCKLKTVPATCPAHCNPNVPNNLCHPTTSCIPLFGAQGDPGLPFGLSYMCACRAGFRADGISAADNSKQVRFSDTEYTSYVFVEPGLSCNTECSPDTNPFPCSEVPRKDDCW